MKVYVAGKNRDDVTRVMDKVRTHGHKITLDWTKLPFANQTDADIDPEIRKVVALAEREAVREADRIVLVYAQDMIGAWLEVGMALEAGKQIDIVGGRESIFWSLPGVRHFSDVNDWWRRTLNDWL